MCQGIVVGGDCHTRNKTRCSDHHFQEEHISKRKGGLSRESYILGIHTQIETTEKGRGLFVSTLESVLDVARKQQASVYVPDVIHLLRSSGLCAGDTIISPPHRQ